MCYIYVITKRNMNKCNAMKKNMQLKKKEHIGCGQIKMKMNSNSHNKIGSCTVLGSGCNSCYKYNKGGCKIQSQSHSLSNSNYVHSVGDFVNVFGSKYKSHNSVGNNKQKFHMKNSMTPKQMSVHNKTTTKDSFGMMNQHNTTTTINMNNTINTFQSIHINKTNNNNSNNLSLKQQQQQLKKVSRKRKNNNNMYKTLLNYSHNFKPKQTHFVSLSNNILTHSCNIIYNKEHHQHQLPFSKTVTNTNKKQPSSTRPTTHHPKSAAVKHSFKKHTKIQSTRQITPMRCFKRIHSSTPNTLRNNSTPHYEKHKQSKLTVVTTNHSHNNNNNNSTHNTKSIIHIKTPQKKHHHHHQLKQKSHSPTITKRPLQTFTHTDKKTKQTTSSSTFYSHKRNFIYTFTVLPGNNGKLIEKCIMTRSNWESVDKSQSNYVNLYWTPLSYQINFYRIESLCQYVNHIESHSELSNKMKLFLNLLRHCEFYKMNLFSFFPMTIIFQLSHTNFDEQLESFKRLYTEINNLISTKPHQHEYPSYISYFKVLLSKRLGSEQKLQFPLTSYTGKNIWLIKPINLNRGRCIKIHNKLDDIINDLNELKEKKLLTDDKNKKISRCEFVLVQKYIEKPLLYKNRKFDIRIWVLFTDQDDVYVFKEGHLKATSDDYSLNTLNPYLHLTNYSVQKNGENFAKVEKGNEISFEEFQNELNAQHHKNFKKDIFPKICNIIKVTALATRAKMNSFINKNSFEIFGYDFLIDCDYNPFLIEINTNPGYEESSPLIKMLLPRMIDDAFRLTIDVAFKRNPEKDLYINTSPFEVKGYSNCENMWLKLKF